MSLDLPPPRRTLDFFRFALAALVGAAATDLVPPAIAPVPAPIALRTVHIATQGGDARADAQLVLRRPSGRLP